MKTELIIYELIMYLNCVFEVYLLSDLMGALFPMYEDRRRIRLLEMVGCITAIFLINMAKDPLVNLVCVPLLFFLYVWLVFRVKWKISVLYVAFYYLIFAVTEFAFLYIYRLLGVEIDRPNLTRILLLAIQATARFAIIQVVKRHLQVPSEDVSYHYKKYFLILPVTSLVLLNGFMVPPAQPYSYLLIVAGCVLLIISNIIIFIVLDKLLNVQQAVSDNGMVAMKTQLEQAHYQRLVEMKQQYNDYIYGVKQILEMAASGDGEKMARMSDEAVRLLQKTLEREECTNDTILNAIFTERRMMAKRLGVRYQIDVQSGVEVGFICESDKIQIFGNLLDNALSAAASCENGYVYASLYKGNESVVIFCVENSFKQEKDRKKRRLFLTAGQDETRKGVGINRVEQLSHKYNGLLKITKNEQRFLAVLMLSNINDLGNSA